MQRNENLHVVLVKATTNPNNFPKNPFMSTISLANKAVKDFADDDLEPDDARCSGMKYSFTGMFMFNLLEIVSCIDSMSSTLHRPTRFAVCSNLVN